MKTHTLAVVDVISPLGCPTPPSGPPPPACSPPPADPLLDGCGGGDDTDDVDCACAWMTTDSGGGGSPPAAAAAAAAPFCPLNPGGGGSPGGRVRRPGGPARGALLMLCGQHGRCVVGASQPTTLRGCAACVRKYVFGPCLCAVRKR